MKKISKRILIIIVITAYVIFSYFWLTYGPDWMRYNYDPYDPVQQAVEVLTIVGIGIFSVK